MAFIPLSNEPARFSKIGGQAVIEGVMMRSPGFVTVAVRKADGRILLRNRSHNSLVRRFKLLGKPCMRGIIILIESMVQGIQALSFSAEASQNSEKTMSAQGGTDSFSSRLLIAGSMSVAFVFGIGLFVVLPHVVTAFMAADKFTVRNPIFHLIDGAIKIIVLIGYVYAISFMKDINRVFQYHGAEHKSIHAFEAGDELIIENARKYPPLHPRCGTSFLFFLVLISIVIFSAVFPMFGLTNHFLMVFIKILLMFPVAGLSYEFIKVCSYRRQSLFFRMLAWPGMALQQLTTREPSDDQLEVALASLKQVLSLEKAAKELNAIELREITGLPELELVYADAAEFPED
ncbi:MAG: DUF1385 domain-containing protein [Bdellovibrionota bacterium]